MTLSEMFSLAGKNVVITGGAGYLGHAMSEGLAEAGANLFIVSKNQQKCQQLAEDLSQRYNVDCHGIFMDVSDNDSVMECFSKINKLGYSIDILVNNAYFGNGGTSETIKDDDWYSGIEGTIHNVYRCTKNVLPYMLSQKSGVIINIASMYGVVSPNPEVYIDNHYNNPPHYGAGKAAIIQYTRYLACHYGSKGIRVNCISPGPFPNLDVQKDQLFIRRLREKKSLK